MLGTFETRRLAVASCFSVTFTTGTTVYVVPVVVSVPSGAVNVAVAVLFTVSTSATVVHDVTSVFPSYTFTVRASSFSSEGSRSKLSPFIVAVICFPLLYSTWSRLRVMLLMANDIVVVISAFTAVLSLFTSSTAFTEAITFTSGSMPSIT